MAFHLSCFSELHKICRADYSRGCEPDHVALVCLREYFQTNYPQWRWSVTHSLRPANQLQQ